MTKAAKSKPAAKPKAGAKSDAHVFPVETRFQTMAKREGGMPREKAIEQAQHEIEGVKRRFDNWLGDELQELRRLMKKAEDAEAGAEWIETANFHSRQLRDSALTLNFELLAFVAGSLCEILDSIEAGSECNMEAVTCHVESLLLAGQASYRHLKPEQVPALTSGLLRVVKRVTAQP
jgi:hypothetical protein